MRDIYGVEKEQDIENEEDRVEKWARYWVKIQQDIDW